MLIMLLILRFFVGPYEEGGFKKKETVKSEEPSCSSFNQIPNYLKSLRSHPLCLHPHSCLYYSIQVQTRYTNQIQFINAFKLDFACNN